MANRNNQAPGAPGISPRWTSSAKSGIGTAFNQNSQVWFTLSHGIFNEIYYPHLTQACTRDMGMLVTDGKDFFSEEKRHTENKIETLAQGIPAYLLTNTCQDGRYRIQKQILSDPRREVVLQQTTFTPLKGKLDDYHLYALLAPHLGNQGANNTAWLGDYKGFPMLFAERAGIGLALACSEPWLKRSAGFVGFSDGWQDLNKHKVLNWSYERADNGNVALTGEVDLANCNGNFVLALGFGKNSVEAGQRALASLLEGFEAARSDYMQEWQEWHHSLLPLNLDDQQSKQKNVYATSMAVLRSHESKHVAGGLIASLSIPWGNAKGDGDLGGYHLVWPRDLAESAGGLLAGGALEDARQVLFYLQVTQEADGHWPQNMWLNGTPYWHGVQMDETAFPILLVDLARREKALQQADIKRLWPMVLRAASFVVQNGPVSQQDRWEEDPGYSPFTLAVEITALLVAADLAELNEESDLAQYLRETADAWNDDIERWIYFSGSDLAKQCGVEGYYVRIAPPEEADAATPKEGFVPIKNRPPGESSEPAAQIVSPDALALVRFGLRAADDPRILNTIKVIDKLLKTDTPYGPLWHRYNDDGYGEHADGSPFDGTGIGRGWPLLTGERGHYELAAGNKDVALKLLHALENFSAGVGLIPEQCWDKPDISEKGLIFGRPSGSAMPLVWAHAEYVKLRRSISDGQIFDLPPQTVNRYLSGKVSSPYSIWRFNHKCRSFPAGKILRIELPFKAAVHWSTNNWQTKHTSKTIDTKLGVHITDLKTDKLASGTQIDFNFDTEIADKHTGESFSVIVE